MSGVLDTVDQFTRLAGHNRMELLLFRLQDQQRYGINVFKVQEVIQCPPLTKVPQSHQVVRGIANLRGRTIPVLDLSLAIGLEPVEDIASSYIIITEYNCSIQGFLVGFVDRIVNMNWADILPPPAASGDDNYLTAVTQLEEDLIEIIDVEKVLAEVTGIAETISDEVLDNMMQESNGKVMHVLVADDSSVARNQVKRTLNDVGIEVTLTTNGKEALDLLIKWAAAGPIHEKISMIVSDIEMPEMDGYTLTTEIRKNPALDSLYVILHTSLSGVFNNAMIEKVGANQFIPKFKPDELAKSVLVQLGRYEEKAATDLAED